MQNRYFGDIGDFAKYGLLRALLLGEPHIQLGVLWYLVPDETTTNDGRHIGYLTTTPKNAKRFRECDPPLYDTLSELVSKGQRAISLVGEHGILPSDTLYYDSPLSYRSVPRADRPALRHRWLSAAVDAMAAADVVFVDPDNGLEVGTDRHAADGPKYTFYEDLLPLTVSGKSLIIYQHASRDESFAVQIQRRLATLRKELRPNARRLTALRFRRVSARAFLFVLSGRHVKAVHDRVNAFLGGPWRQHFDKVSLTQMMETPPNNRLQPTRGQRAARG
jgi:hypothetical protein